MITRSGAGSGGEQTPLSAWTGASGAGLAAMIALAACLLGGGLCIGQAIAGPTVLLPGVHLVD